MEMATFAFTYTTMLARKFQPQLILDLGSGSGLGTTHPGLVLPYVMCLDTSEAMLTAAREKWRANARQTPRMDFVLANMAHNLPFRCHTFDAYQSISALQWLLPKDVADSRMTNLLSEAVRCGDRIQWLWSSQLYLSGSRQETFLARAVQEINVTTEGQFRPTVFTVRSRGRSLVIFVSMQAPQRAGGEKIFFCGEYAKTSGPPVGIIPSCCASKRWPMPCFLEMIRRCSAVPKKLSVYSTLEVTKHWAALSRLSRVARQPQLRARYKLVKLARMLCEDLISRDITPTVGVWKRVLTKQSLCRILHGPQERQELVNTMVCTPVGLKRGSR